MSGERHRKAGTCSIKVLTTASDIKNVQAKAGRTVVCARSRLRKGKKIAGATAGGALRLRGVCVTDNETYR